MNRNDFLHVPYYLNTHDFLVTLIMALDGVVSNYLNENQYQNYLISRKSITGNMSGRSIYYGVYYHFFDDTESTEVKENEVSFTVILRVNPSDADFRILTSIDSPYKVIQGKDILYKKNELSIDQEERDFFKHNVLREFLDVMSIFFRNKLAYIEVTGILL